MCETVKLIHKHINWKILFNEKKKKKIKCEKTSRFGFLRGGFTGGGRALVRLPGKTEYAVPEIKLDFYGDKGSFTEIGMVFTEIRVVSQR